MRFCCVYLYVSIPVVSYTDQQIFIYGLPTWVNGYSGIGKFKQYIRYIQKWQRNGTTGETTSDRGTGQLGQQFLTAKEWQRNGTTGATTSDSQEMTEEWDNWGNNFWQPRNNRGTRQLGQQLLTAKEWQRNGTTGATTSDSQGKRKDSWVGTKKLAYNVPHLFGIYKMDLKLARHMAQTMIRGQTSVL